MANHILPLQKAPREALMEYGRRLSIFVGLVIAAGMIVVASLVLINQAVLNSETGIMIGLGLLAGLVTIVTVSLIYLSMRKRARLTRRNRRLDLMYEAVMSAKENDTAEMTAVLLAIVDETLKEKSAKTMEPVAEAELVGERLSSLTAWGAPELVSLALSMQTGCEISEYDANSLISVAVNAWETQRRMMEKLDIYKTNDIQKYAVELFAGADHLLAIDIDDSDLRQVLFDEHTLIGHMLTKLIPHGIEPMKEWRVFPKESIGPMVATLHKAHLVIGLVFVHAAAKELGLSTEARYVVQEIVHRTEEPIGEPQPWR